MNSHNSINLNKKFPAKKSSIVICSLLGIITTSHAAEQVSDKEVKKNSDSIEVINITASKREKSQQDIPLSVSTLGKGDIELLGVDDLEGIVKTIPGITMNQPIKNRSFINIRGLATSVAGGNTQDPVSVYINDMPVTDTFGASVQPDLRLYDVERVEVLRGPQGTLFGSGALAGTVRIITKKPDLDSFDASVRVDFSDTSEASGNSQKYDAMVNVPIVEDVFAIRAVGYYRDISGWVKNDELATSNSTVDKGGRLSGAWRYSDSLNASFEILYQNSEPEDSDSWNPELGKYKKISTIREGRPSKIKTYNATVNYEMEDFATFVSSTSSTQSETGVSIDYGDVTGLGFPLLAKNKPWVVDFLTQEFRLVSNTNSNIEWLAGLFYINRESNATFNFTLPGLADFFNSNVAPGLLDNDVFLETQTKVTSKELAIFGESSFSFSDSWVFTIGGRLSNAESDISEPERRVLNFATFQKDSVVFENGGEEKGIFTWRTSLAYEHEEHLNFYGSISTGYRIGQPNPFVGKSAVDPNDPLEIPNLYEPDETTNYELGLKALLMDNKVRLNLAAYYIDWDNIQVEAIRLSDVANYIANAGQAVSKGLELEVEARPHRGVKFNLSATRQDSKITSISDENSIRSGVQIDDKLPGSPDYKVSISGQYDWELTSQLDAYVRVGGQKVGSSTNGFSQSAGSTAPNPFFDYNSGYENVEASFGLLFENYEVTFYGENLTNNDDVILHSGGATRNYANTLRPRTIGVRFHYRYF